MALVELIKELDGKGRQINYEYNHCPETDTRLFPWQDVTSRVPGFQMSNGDFYPELSRSVYNIALNKETSTGPWVNNELNAGSGDATELPVDAAYIRRHVWGNLAYGTMGYQLWAFPNIIGAPYEFTVEAYNPIVPNNLPMKYFELKHCNQMIDSLGALLPSSIAPKADIGLLYLDDSTYGWTYTPSYWPDAGGLFDALSARGYSDQLGVMTEWQLDNQDLSRFKVLFLPQTARMLESHGAALAKYVKNGGTLVLMGDTARVGEMLNENAAFPAGPLAEVTGIEATKLNDVEIKNVPYQFTANGQKVNCDIITRIAVPRGSTAKVIGTVQMPGKDGSKPAATVNDYGSGKCYYLAGRLFMTDSSDPTSGFVDSILRSAGVVPGAVVTEGDKPATGVVVARRTGPAATLIFLIENEDMNHNVSVALDAKALGLDKGQIYNVFECFSDEKHQISAENGWKFDTTVEPIGVRVYAITTAVSLDVLIPGGKTMIIPREAGALVDGGKTKIGPKQLPYKTTDILTERRGRLHSYTLEASDAQPMAPIKLDESFAAVDLKGFVNEPVDELIGKGTPVKEGIVKLGRVPALVAMNGENCLVKSTYSVKGMRVGRKADRIHFFDGGHYNEHTGVVGSYLIHYADGTTETIPLVDGITTGNFGSLEPEFSRTQILWKGFNDKKDYRYLYRYDWVNLHPEKVIYSIDANAEISIWAITLENDK